MRPGSACSAWGSRLARGRPWFDPQRPMWFLSAQPWARSEHGCHVYAPPPNRETREKVEKDTGERPERGHGGTEVRPWEALASWPSWPCLTGSTTCSATGSRSLTPGRSAVRPPRGGRAMNINLVAGEFQHLVLLASFWHYRELSLSRLLGTDDTQCLGALWGTIGHGTFAGIPGAQCSELGQGPSDAFSVTTQHQVGQTESS